MLVSGIQQSDSDVYVCACMCVCIYIFFFRFFSVIGYYKILNMLSCAI